MPLDMEVGLGPGHFVFDRDPVTSRKRADPPHPIFGPCLLWLNGWMDGTAPNFRPICLLWVNGRPPQLLLSSCSLLFLVGFRAAD